MGGRHPWEEQSSGENLRPVMRAGPLEAEQLWGRVAPWRLPQDRWGNWGTRPNKNFPTGGSVVIGQLSGSHPWLHVGVPQELWQIPMLGSHSRTIMSDCWEREQALVFAKAPMWLQWWLGGLGDPGAGLLRQEVQTSLGGGGCMGLGISSLLTAFYLDSWLWGWKYFPLKDWGSQILESFSLASLFLPED